MSPKPGREPTEPSDWVRRFAPLIRPGGTVLDLAYGGGRHTRFLAGLGHSVTAVDIDLTAAADLAGQPRVALIAADLEAGTWPLPDRLFAAIVVTNYLWRPLLGPMFEALDRDGILIYETFARGNGRFGKPANPDFLLEPGELLDLVRGRLHVVAYEHGIVDRPRPAARQRLCAVNRPSDPDGLTLLPEAQPA